MPSGKPLNAPPNNSNSNPANENTGAAVMARSSFGVLRLDGALDHGIAAKSGHWRNVNARSSRSKAPSSRSTPRVARQAHLADATWSGATSDFKNVTT